MSHSRLAIIPGDPNGIGPELIAKLIDSGAVGKTPLRFVGDQHLFDLGTQQAGLGGDFQALVSSHQIDAQYDWLDTCRPGDVQLGQVTESGGRSTLRQIDHCLALCQSGAVPGYLFGPFNKAAMHMAGLGHDDELHYMADPLNFDGHVCELNVMDRLFTSRVTSHIALKDVSANINPPEILRAISLLDRTLKSAGNANPQISVAALNPHAGDECNFGREEIDIIAPAVAEARAQGFNVDGPWPSDTVFLKAKAGTTDAVVTMYHDQGQIEMKLMGFDRGVTIQGGLPYPVTTPAHGTAYDIAGQGAADVGATRAAFELLRDLSRHS